MRSSRSNWTSSKAAAMPCQPGIAAGSVLQTRALVTATTLPRPKGLLTRTISSSMKAPIVSCLGQRKWTPVELMLRVTSVIGNSSGCPSTLRRRIGRFRLARGYSRCSGCTPTACVGTRTKRRGCAGWRSGARRRAGTRGASGISCGPAADSRAASAGSSGHDSNGATRFVALIKPSETPLYSRWLWPNKLNNLTDFLDLPRPRLCGAER